MANICPYWMMFFFFFSLFFFFFQTDLYWSNLSLSGGFHLSLLFCLLFPSPNNPVQPVPAPVQALLPHTTNDKVIYLHQVHTSQLMSCSLIFFCQSHGLCSYLVVWSVLATKFSFVIQPVSFEINCNIQQGTQTSFSFPLHPACDLMSTYASEFFFCFIAKLTFIWE